MDIVDFLRKLHGNPDTSEWQRVTKLKPEDLLREKKLSTDIGKLEGEADVLKAKIHALRAQASSQAIEWWEYVHQEYCLPRSSNFTITDDGYILMQPTNEKEKPV